MFLGGITWLRGRMSPDSYWAKTSHVDNIWLRGEWPIKFWFRHNMEYYMGFPGGASGKEPACQCKRHKRLRFAPWVGKIPWKRAWQPSPVSLSGESHEQRSLAGYSPWGDKESDMTEATYHSTPYRFLIQFNHLWLMEYLHYLCLIQFSI